MTDWNAVYARMGNQGKSPGTPAPFNFAQFLADKGKPITAQSGLRMAGVMGLTPEQIAAGQAEAMGLSPSAGALADRATVQWQRDREANGGAYGGYAVPPPGAVAPTLGTTAKGGFPRTSTVAEPTVTQPPASGTYTRGQGNVTPLGTTQPAGGAAPVGGSTGYNPTPSPIMAVGEGGGLPTPGGVGTRNARESYNSTTAPAAVPGAVPPVNPVSRGGSLPGTSPIPSTLGGVAGQRPQGDIGYGFDVGEFYDPSYDWRLQQSLDAMEQSASARGSLMSGETQRALAEHAGNAASQEYGAAFGRGTNVRDFTSGLDRYDQGFDLAAEQADRSFEFQRQLEMARLGQTAAGQANSGANGLAGLIAQIIQNRGQIQGTGTIGANNAINGPLGQIVNFLMQQGYLSNMGTKPAGA
jgi:hypothetical protein